jgi:hypothetical protein
VHLVCRNLHQIANLHANPKLSFDRRSPEDLESLLQSSRIFKELAFCSRSEYLLSQEKFEILEEYLGCTGPHIKKLAITGLEVDPKIFQKLLTMLPNLKTLELDRVSSSDQSIKWVIKTTKIERFKMTHCFGLESLFESLEKCAIKELILDCGSDLETIKKFLKSQEKNLKKIIGMDHDLKFLFDLKDLRLEYFKFSVYRCQGDLLKFLKEQVDLKVLKVYLPCYWTNFFDIICELRELETLELQGDMLYSCPCENLHKLENLKRLYVYGDVYRNVLRLFRSEVCHSLEEIFGSFEYASLESIQEMNRITPNLKKLAIHEASSETINDLLENLESLEALHIFKEDWKLSKKVCSNIKYLIIRNEVSAEQFTQEFPNLEYLNKHCYGWSTEVLDSFFVTLLSGLKQLKTLHLEISTSAIKSKLNPESILQYFQEYGKNLEEVNVVFYHQGLELEQWCIRDFAIEKRPGDSFRINKIDCSFEAPWMREIFNFSE